MTTRSGLFCFGPTTRCACGGKLKIIAVIEQPDVIARMLTHLGLSGRPPPRAAARREELFEGA